MNTEIVRRLSNSFQETDKTNIIADTLLNGLDHEIVNALIEKAVGRRTHEVRFKAALRRVLLDSQGAMKKQGPKPKSLSANFAAPSPT
jgi:hypothetical protein